MNWAERVKKIRVPLGFLFGALYLFFAPVPTALTFAVGISLAFVGLLIRAWAAGHIVKNDRLATTGPYAHTRNPLYFGSFLIGAGFAIAAHWSLLLFVIAFFAAIYGPTIGRERAFVSERFPDEYAEYERNVPAFVPRPLPWRSEGAEEHEGFSLKIYNHHREWRAALAFVAVVTWLILRMKYVV